MTKPKDKKNEVAASNQTAVTTTPQTTPMVLVQMAVEQGADVDKLEKLLAMQERWEANEARKAYVKAMSAFKAEHLTILKDKNVKYTNSKNQEVTYDHATLDNVCSISNPVLSKHGLSSKWLTAPDGEKTRVTCVITHILGHSDEVSLSAAPDTSGGKNHLQAIGSTISYLERYTYLAITGLSVKDQDDDGLGGAQNTKMPEGEFESWKKKIKATKTKPEAEKITIEIAAACKKYNDLDANTRLRGVYTIHIGKLSK